MVGIIVVTHGNLGRELLNTLEMIIRRRPKNMKAVAILSSDKGEDTGEKILKAIKDVDKGQGVLILTDMFGGSATNISLSFFKSPIKLLQPFYAYGSS